jgi:hypothetical protein
MVSPPAVEIAEDDEDGDHDHRDLPDGDGSVVHGGDGSRLPGAAVVLEVATPGAAG